jgi:hypothetical protein
MSFLYPLFLAGIAGVALPIILHMIRRQTRKRVTFSSLMFLRTTVPRFKNRSRLENLPLLILRCIILCLLAFAFSRPFFPRQTEVNKVSVAGRTVLLIDTSASMRRTGIWPRAINEAQSVLKGAGPNDRVCMMRFDQNAQTLIGFEQWVSVDPDRRKAAAAEQFAKLSPSWASTNLGQALVTAAEAIEDDEVNDEQSTGWPSPQKFRTCRIVLITDLQKGSNLEALQAYEWPEGLELQVKLIAAQGPTNASLQLVEGPHFAKRLRNGNPESRDRPAVSSHDDTPSVCITNSSNATVERFSLSWAGDPISQKNSEMGTPGNDRLQTSNGTTEVYVPAGHNVVVQAPNRADNSAPGKLVLAGDDQDFDNALYVAPHLTYRVNILFIGSDSEGDSEGMLYYVRRAFRATGSINPVVISRQPQNLTDAEIEAAHLIIATEAIMPERISPVHKYLESGRTVLLVMKSPDSAKTIAALTGNQPVESKEADAGTYAMFNRIDFKHPLLAPFSEPRFGDFTKIHFWKHRHVNIDDLTGAKVLAWFDNNDPALFELHVGKGSLLVLTCGWQPSDSQLALSSKFVPLLYSILEYSGISEGRQSQYFVGDRVPISVAAGTGPANTEIRRPDDSLIRLSADEESFAQTDMPGIYIISSEGVPPLRPTGILPVERNKGKMPSPQTQEQDALATNRVFALNLPASESQTDVMPIENLEEMGVSLTQSSVYSAERAGLSAGSRNILAGRHISSLAMESEQKIWRWILIGLLVVSFIEITLAGWLTRSPSKFQGEQK